MNTRNNQTDGYHSNPIQLSFINQVQLSVCLLRLQQLYFAHNVINSKSWIYTAQNRIITYSICDYHE